MLGIMMVKHANSESDKNNANSRVVQHRNVEGGEQTRVTRSIEAKENIEEGGRKKTGRTAQKSKTKTDEQADKQTNTRQTSATQLNALLCLSASIESNLQPSKQG